jgi:hypothetical protein
MEVSSKDDGNAKDSSSNDGITTDWPWPHDLDAMIAAPGFHTVLTRTIGSEFSTDASRLVRPLLCTPTDGEEFSTSLRLATSCAAIPTGTYWPTPVCRSPHPPSGPPCGAPLTPHSFENVGGEEFPH